MKIVDKYTLITKEPNNFGEFDSREDFEKWLPRNTIYFEDNELIILVNFYRNDVIRYKLVPTVVPVVYNPDTKSFNELE